MKTLLTIIVTIIILAGVGVMALQSEDEIDLIAETGSAASDQAKDTYGRDIPGLPEFCASEPISMNGCAGLTELKSEQGNKYSIQQLGHQCWMSENLREIPDKEGGCDLLP